MLIVEVVCISAQCLIITEKVSLNITTEASYVGVLSGQKYLKNAKNSSFLSASYICSRFYIFKILLLLFVVLVVSQFVKLEQFYSSGTILFFWNNFILLE